MALLDTHNPWTLVPGLLGVLLSFAVFLCAVPTFYKIWKKRSSEGFESTPYLLILFSAQLWLYYATQKILKYVFLLKSVFLLITVNSCCCFLELAFICIFVAFASKKARMLTLKLLLLMNVGAFCLIVLLCQFLAKGFTRIKIIGGICVGVSVCVFAAPLIIIRTVIKTRSVKYMPFSLSLIRTINAGIWFLYGLARRDIYVFFPNGLGIILGVLQIIFFVVYKYCKTAKLPEVTPEADLVINVSALENRDDSQNDDSMSSLSDIDAYAATGTVTEDLPEGSPLNADHVQSQAFSALQVLEVIETNTQPSDLCTRREYARWLVSASSALSRNTTSKVYPAMYIENVTELAFDDVTPEDPDFSSIQGLAEAGLITSKLSNGDLLDDDEGTVLFSPESLLSRQDLLSWKMALEKRQLPEADKKMLYELSGFIDIEKVNPDAWPAIIADLSTGEQGITALAFGCTRLFQPHKPVTKGQAAIALSSGEASEIVSEELARIEAESMAETAVSAHSALVAEVEKDVNASFEKELSIEREKIEAVQKMAELAKAELEQLKEKREEENLALVKERAAVESEMEVLSRLRREAEEKLEELMSNKAEISFEKERVSNLRKEAEEESQRISKLQNELEVERKALSMARSWAEEEAKRAKEQGRALEEARKRWEINGLRVVVDKDLQETTGETEQIVLLNDVERSSVEETEERAKTLMDKLREMAGTVGGKSREVIFIVMQKIQLWIAILKEYAENLGKQAGETRDAAVVKAKEAAEEVGKGTVVLSDKVKRIAEECRDGVGKISQKFKT